MSKEFFTLWKLNVKVIWIGNVGEYLIINKKLQYFKMEEEEPAIETRIIRNSAGSRFNSYAILKKL